MFKFKLFFIYLVVDNYNVEIVLYTKNIWPLLNRRRGSNQVRL